MYCSEWSTMWRKTVIQLPAILTCTSTDCPVVQRSLAHFADGVWKTTPLCTGAEKHIDSLFISGDCSPLPSTRPHGLMGERILPHICVNHHKRLTVLKKPLCRRETRILFRLTSTNYSDTLWGAVVLISSFNLRKVRNSLYFAQRAVFLLIISAFAHRQFLCCKSLLVFDVNLCDRLADHIVGRAAYYEVIWKSIIVTVVRC